MWARRLLLFPIGLACFLPSLGLAGPRERTESQQMRVRIAGPVEAAAVRDAVRGAQRRLQNPECREIFSDFADASGRPLQSVLDDSGWSAEGYLGLIGFFDGDRRCVKGDLMAFTAPGSRVVFICPQFRPEWQRDRRFTEIVILHEALHSLGLGENPPSSREITARVTRRCSGRPQNTHPATAATASGDRVATAEKP